LQDRSTDFEFLPIDVSLDRCYRYFEKNAQEIAIRGSSSTSVLRVPIPFDTTKRASPTIILAGAGITNASSYGGGTKNLNVNFNEATTDAYLSFTADAEL